VVRHGKTITKLGIVNAYRIIHEEAPLDVYVNEIHRAIQHRRTTHGVKKYLVVGDFNKQHVSINGLHEIHHVDLYHEHIANEGVDKVLSNDPSGILWTS
jgi:hypothetical protein